MNAADAPRSLRRDLALGLSLGLCAFWLMAMAAAAQIVGHELEQIFDAALRQTAERILPLAVIEQANSGEAPATRHISTVGPHREGQITYVLRDRDGRIVLASEDADLAVFAQPLAEGFHNVNDHRVHARFAVSGTYRIEVAEPLSYRREARRETIGFMFLPLLLLLPASLAGIAVFTRARLAPVAALSAEVAGRDASDLSALSTPGLQEELVPIRDAVNRLMTRLARTLEAERGFTANAAHELRTPMAAVLAQTQRLLAEAPEGPLRQRALTIEAELKRLARLAEKLLHLSRAEGGGVLAGADSDVAPILALVGEDFARAGHGGRLRLALPEGGARLRIDPDAFAILARNLIENALTHGDPATPVEVRLSTGGTLTVTNAGPVIPAETLTRLTTRFERAGSRGSGSGLGLAIAAAIARGTGAALTLASPAPGRHDGFEARFTPCAP
ncbi:ATP-binding protein [Pseudochelatococcus lubricantis]|uniref:ATP-binding protein n=1 Tax=Pseudochelatococcus lubricantis TaxID=1538102 RepID=UPI0035E876DB